MCMMGEIQKPHTRESRSGTGAGPCQPYITKPILSQRKGSYRQVVLSRNSLRDELSAWALVLFFQNSCEPPANPCDEDPGTQNTVGEDGVLFRCLALDVESREKKIDILGEKHEFLIKRVSRRDSRTPEYRESLLHKAVFYTGDKGSPRQEARNNSRDHSLAFCFMRNSAI